MPRQPLNIIILGGSFAGLSVAHNFLDKVIHQLSTFEAGPMYRVILISPSTHLYWNICAPRALITPKWISLDDVFIPIEPGFARHPFNEFTFMQGRCIAVDTSARTVTIELVHRHNKVQTLPYHALIIATGSSAHSPLYSLHGTHEETLAELRDFHRRLEKADSVLIVGGGPSGVETAGQLAVYFNRGRKWGDTITLLSGGHGLLGRLPPKVGKRAEKQLKNLGVHIVHNIRQLTATINSDGSSNCILNTDMTITSDLLISATGVSPNTSFLPSHILDENGYVMADRETLRVWGRGIGDRVYAIGDCGAYSKNYVLDVYEPIPTLMQNLHNDLLAHEYFLQTLAYLPTTPSLEPDTLPSTQRKIAALQDAHYRQNPTETQIMPITRFGGVGVVFGWRVPSLAVWAFKGRDYKVKRARACVGKGGNPYEYRPGR
ncbi:FAD/NAD(P)-binding domain-containing protein [Polyplosphaeria fusca]|uniref:FAD/NAD(P)-binding domain-containing protein n=1 Tax=Polyplosphaeria fusca TaxID=682080 RepID=A0A9P4QX93_9PLEO|nr:FAD/NAD(P)-binding domain-containing protein [Polyplosphaeria fusca]